MESFGQRIPLVSLGAALVAAALCLAVPSGPVVRLLMWTMVLNLAMGVAGLALHYKGNVEFELEMYPSMGGWELVRESLTGALPALAPGTMIYLGLLGWAATFRHPLLANVSATQEEDS